MKFKINNIKWDIYLVDGFEEYTGTMGRTSFMKGKIEILRGLPMDRFRTTVVHELIHAFISSYGITCPNPDSVMLFSEEQVCEFIAMHIEEIISLTNKVIVNLLKKEV